MGLGDAEVAVLDVNPANADTVVTLDEQTLARQVARTHHDLLTKTT